MCDTTPLRGGRSWLSVHEHSLKAMDYKYAGMTVNERLHVAGLLREFENAVREGDREEAIRILKEVKLTDENIDPILEKWGLK